VIGDPQEGPEGLREQAAACLFADTHWSVVLRARDKSQAALGRLCESYRQALIVWLRSRGHTAPDAEDLVQGFMAHLLADNSLNNVAREKGRFRTFLLKCFVNYLRDQRDRGAAAKRGGGLALVPLDETADNGKRLHDPPAPEAPPDLAFDRAWANAVVDNALRRLEEECAQQGHLALCSELKPVMFADVTASPYEEIGARLGMSEGAVKTAAHRIRIRLRGLIGDEVAQTVASEEDLTDEIRYLIRLFGPETE
jgi:RNA polymerase sigma-70 factor (ECF subfamily)